MVHRMVFVYESPIRKGREEASRKKFEGKMSRRGAESDDDKGYCKEAQDS